MATTQKRKAVSKTRKRTVTIEDEVLSLASSPMTKTVQPKKKAAAKTKAKKTTVKKAATKTKVTAKKVASKKPTATKTVAKKTPARKTAAKKSTTRTVRTRKPATIRETIAAEMRAVETETKQIAKNPTLHKMVRFSELYVLSVLVTVIILATVTWTQTVLNLL